MLRGHANLLYSVPILVYVLLKQSGRYDYPKLVEYEVDIQRALMTRPRSHNPNVNTNLTSKYAISSLTLCRLMVIYSTELLCFLSLALFFFFLKVRGREFGWASLVGQLVKNPPAMRETWVQSLGWKDPLEEERSPRVILTPVFLSGEPPWTEEPGR